MANSLRFLGELSSFQLYEFQVQGIFLNVQGSGVQTSAFPKLDETLGFQQVQGTGFIGGVIGNADLGTRHIRNTGQSLGVEAHGLEVNLAGRNQIGAVLLVVVIEVRGVLEEVCVQIAFIQGDIGHYIVSEFYDLQFIAIGSELIFGEFQDLSMRRGEAPTRITVLEASELELSAVELSCCPSRQPGKG